MTSMGEHTNTELAKIAQSGDDTAFGMLFDRNRGWVYRRARRMFRSHEDAEDAVNDVFLKAWRKLGQWNGEGTTFESWFTALCSNTLIDIQRGRNAAKNQGHRLASEAELEFMERQADLTQSDPLTSLVSEELMLHIETVLCGMPETNRRQRLVWILHYLEGYPYREVARILNISPSTARAHGHRCNQKLRRFLRERMDR